MSSTSNINQSYIFPMINPDGVIYGNSRCNLAGVDINRQWTRPNKIIHPVPYFLGKFTEQLINQGYQIDYFLDFHGHSKKSNCFIYACEHLNEKNEILGKEYPLMLSKINEIFSFKDCTFGLHWEKETTARALMYYNLTTPNIFTIETSMHGYMLPNKTIQDYIPSDFRKLGQDILKAMYIYEVKEDKDYDFKRNQLQTLLNDYKNEKENNLQLQENQEIDNGSDSDPMADEFNMNDKLKKFISANVAQKIGIMNNNKLNKLQKKRSVLLTSVRNVPKNSKLIEDANKIKEFIKKNQNYYQENILSQKQKSQQALVQKPKQITSNKAYIIPANIHLQMKYNQRDYGTKTETNIPFLTSPDKRNNYKAINQKASNQYKMISFQKEDAHYMKKIRENLLYLNQQGNLYQNTNLLQSGISSNNIQKLAPQPQKPQTQTASSNQKYRKINQLQYFQPINYQQTQTNQPSKKITTTVGEVNQKTINKDSSQISSKTCYQRSFSYRNYFQQSQQQHQFQEQKQSSKSNNQQLNSNIAVRQNNYPISFPVDSSINKQKIADQLENEYIRVWRKEKKHELFRQVERVKKIVRGNSHEDNDRTQFNQKQAINNNQTKYQDQQQYFNNIFSQFYEGSYNK